ncbi:hypothetical protein FEM08_04810 [Flavobacterium gilvum]|nr:hypothetical protein FEM08_04810 [Flavobacterium gilvum]
MSLSYFFVFSQRRKGAKFCTEFFASLRLCESYIWKKLIEKSLT